MNRTYRKRKGYQIMLTLTMLAVLLMAQYDLAVRTATDIPMYWHTQGDTDVAPELRTWIYEDNSAGSVVFFHQGSSTEQLSWSRRYLANRNRAEVLVQVVFMEALLTLLLTAFLVPRRQFILELERESIPRRCGPLFVRFQHNLDGEKDGGYDFLPAI